MAFRLSILVSALRNKRFSIIEKSISAPVKGKTKRATGIFILFVCCWVIATPVFSDNEIYNFNLSQMRAADALLKIASLTDTPLVVPFELVDSLQTNALNGDYTLKQAVSLVLDDTGLKGSVNEQGILVVSRVHNNNQINGSSSLRGNSMPSSRTRKFFGGIYAFLLGTASGGAAIAQEESSNQYDTVEEILVTARKRNETLQEVPIQVSVVTGDQLDKFGTTEFTDLQNRVAGLNLSIGGSAGGGGAIGLRGISTSSNQAGFEQSVSVVVDNVQVSRPGVMAAALFDVSQVDVIKGPQALFYGKNTPAGAIEIRTNGPTDEFEGFLTSSYEFEAEEIKLIGAYGGPITEDFGFRIAALYRDMDGWFENGYTEPLTDDTLFDYSTSGIPQPGDSTPGSSEWAIRGTLAGDLTESWSTSFKISYADYEDDGPLRESEITRCGSTEVHTVRNVGLNTSDNCRIDGRNTRANLTEEMLFDWPYAQAEHYSETEQLFVSFNNDFKLSDTLTLTAITGIFNLDTALQDNFDYSPFNIFPSTEAHEYESFTQEVRLGSDFSGPFNFLVGAFYEDSSLDYLSAARFRPWGADPTTGRFFTWERANTTDTETLSAFAQVIYDLSETVELSGGVRFTNETRDSTMQHLYTHAIFAGGFLALPVGIVLEDSQEVDDTSPEITLTWRPSDDLSIYGSYKEGYKSGGMALSSVMALFRGTGPEDQAAIDAYTEGFTFEPEYIDGFEVGLKTQWLNDRLTFNVAAFDYDYTDLQVSQFDSASDTFRISNAAAASVTGIELETNWRMNQHLSVWAGLNWLDATYDDYLAECYDLQTVEQGCVPVEGSSSSVFQREGQALTRAPEWSAVFGFDATQYIGNDIEVGYSLSGVYTDEHETAAIGNPLTFQDSYTKVDAGVRLTWKNKYKFALYGRNLTDELVTSRLSDAPGSSASTDAARILRGRQIALELGVDF